MKIVGGKAISQKILDEIRIDLNSRPVSLPRRQAGIAALWAGNNLAIGKFVEMKKKAAESVGIKMDGYRFKDPADMEAKLKELAIDENISGIIVELPLPQNFNRDEILNLIPGEKDIDVLSFFAQEKFYNSKSKILPPAVEAMKTLFEEYKIDPARKTATVFGQSILIGKPISHWLETQGAKIFRIDENTENSKELCLRADIVVSGVGKPKLITGEMVKDGAIIVDFKN